MLKAQRENFHVQLQYVTLTMNKRISTNNATCLGVLAISGSDELAFVEREHTSYQTRSIITAQRARRCHAHLCAPAAYCPINCVISNNAIRVSLVVAN